MENRVSITSRITNSQNIDIDINIQIVSPINSQDGKCATLIGVEFME